MGALGSEDGPSHYIFGYFNVSLAAILAGQEMRLYVKCGSFYARLCCSRLKRFPRAREKLLSLANLAV